MKPLLFVTALLLAGCAQQFAEKDHQDCQSYGYAPDTVAYSQCRESLAAQRAAYLRGLSVVGAANLSAPSYPTYNRPTTSNCFWMGQQLVCHTN